MEFQYIYMCVYRNIYIPNWIPIIPSYIVCSVHLVLESFKRHHRSSWVFRTYLQLLKKTYIKPQLSI